MAKKGVKPFLTKQKIDLTSNLKSTFFALAMLPNCASFYIKKILLGF